MQSSAQPRSMQRSGLRPAAELAADKPHGMRIKYLAGCRCQLCRAANCNKQKERARAQKQGDWNGIVPAAAARAHLARLSAAGVGRRTVCDVTGVADTVLQEIKNGAKQRIRARTERLILGVTAAAAADGALTDARPSWKRIEQLLELGYTKAFLARQLGYTNPALQFKAERITVRNAYDVQCLHERLRHVPARRTLALLKSFADEGFAHSRVEQLLRDRAAVLGQDVPDLTLRCDKVLASTARLVQLLHAEIVDEEAAA